MILLFSSQRNYESFEELIRAIQAHGKNEGYAVLIKRFKSIYSLNVKRKYVLMCEREDTTKRKPDAKPRKIESKKCGCEFRVNAIFKQHLNVWKMKIRESQHNHEVVEEKDIETIAAIRNIEKNDDFYERVTVTTRADTFLQFFVDRRNERLADQTSTQILTNERLKRSDTKLIIEDIYKAKKIIRKVALDRYTPTQVLLKTLHHRRWFVKIKLRKRINEVKRMFFVDKDVVKILSQNSKILIIDCTYKINRYKMRLMTIADQTGLRTTFLISFGFIFNEKESNYAWVIEQIESLYRSLDLKNFEIVITNRDKTLVNALNENYLEVFKFLCVWHINKNVIKNCRSSFDDTKKWDKFYNMWHAVVNASIAKACVNAWNTLCNEYDLSSDSSNSQYDSHHDDVKYLYDTWIEPLTHRFCRFVTNRVLHFDIIITSRVENMHRVLKLYLKFFTDDLMNMIEKIEMMLTNQYKNYFARFAKVRRNVAWVFQITVFRDFVDQVISYALWKIHGQYEKLRESTEETSLFACNRFYIKFISLSCNHIIKAKINVMSQKLGRISITDVHPHWRFKKSEFEIAVIREFSSDTVVIVQLLNNSMKDENDQEVENVDRAILDPTANENFDSHMSKKEFKIVFRNLKRNAHIERSSSDAENSIDENIENVKLTVINESRPVKNKSRPKNSKNQKPLMTRTKKIVAKSTTRNPSEFEYVETAVEIQKQDRAREKRGAREERDAREKREAKRGRDKRKEREERDEQTASLTVTERLQTLKNEVMTKKAARQRYLNEPNDTLEPIKKITK